MWKNCSRASALRRIPGFLLLALAIACAIPLVAVDGVAAQEVADATALARDIDKQLRSAENDMFNGKNEQADQQMQSIAGEIERLRAADPENSRLTSLQSKYERLRKNLDRKLGLGATAGAPSAAPPPKPAAATAPAAAPAATATAADAAQEAQDAQLPRAVLGDLGNARSKLELAESGWAEDFSGQSTVQGSTDPREVKREMVSDALRSATYYYDSIITKCQRKSSPCDPDHPEIAGLRSRLEAMQANLATLKQELAQAEEERAAAEEERVAQARALEQECEAWNDRFEVYTDGDKAMYRCVSAGAEQMALCRSLYDEAVALVAELGATPWADEPCDSLRSTRLEFDRYLENFASTYEAYEKENAAALANLGEIVFSKSPIDPDDPSGLETRFAAGDTIYGLIQTKRPWSEIYSGKGNPEVMVNVTLDDQKIHAQFVKIRNPALTAQQHLVFEIAPDPEKMTAYDDPDREYGASTATMRQGPHELTHHLGQLGPGEHTMRFDITYFGTTWAAGGFTISGSDFGHYASLHKKIAKAVADAVRLPPAQMTDKAMASSMKALLENAGWQDIRRINIVDKDWWLDRVSGGDSAVKSRHVAAAALARDGAGWYYRVCTFHQDRLLTGGFGELYLSHQGDRVPVPEANIDK